MANPQEMEDLLDEMYNAFTPMPLQPGDPAYVDCRAVRGDADVVEDLGRTVSRSREFTYQLYSGYRGSGKTTELLRLKKDLEDRGHVVVYFAADEEDISVQDAQYTDILLACTRHLLKKLKEEANSAPILDWLKGRLKNLKAVMLTEINIDQINLEVGLKEFAKITAAVRTEPGQRQKIREMLEPHTETLIQALNAFIANDNQLSGKSKLLVIADNLDRIVPIFRDNGRSNHEEIFLDRHEQLKALNCHIIYTVPISLIYSRWATELKDNYGIPQVLPSIMVRQIDGDHYCTAGLDILKTIIRLRLSSEMREVFIPQVFESDDVLQELCLTSGGYVRDLVQLMQEAITKTDVLPISAKAVQRATDALRDVYRRAVEEDQWEVLRQVHQSKGIENDDIHRSLLFSRCVLEYRYFDNQGDKRTWYDVHPVLWKEL
jgi:AAA ATPase domain